MNTPGKGLLIGAGVALLVFGIIGLIGARGMLQAAPLMGLVSTFVFGMSFRAFYTMMLIVSIVYIVFGIAALVYCGDRNKAGMLQIQGSVLLGYEIFGLIFFVPQLIRLTGFSVLYVIGPGLAILYIVGAVKNKNAVPFRNYGTVKKCRQCSVTYTGANVACPHCGSSLYEETRDNRAIDNTVPSSPLASNVGDTWFCKKCDTMNPLTAPTCKDCGSYK